MSDTRSRRQRSKRGTGEPVSDTRSRWQRSKPRHLPGCQTPGPPGPGGNDQSEEPVSDTRSRRQRSKRGIGVRHPVPAATIKARNRGIGVRHPVSMATIKTEASARVSDTRSPRSRRQRSKRGTGVRHPVSMATIKTEASARVSDTGYPGYLPLAKIPAAHHIVPGRCQTPGPLSRLPTHLLSCHVGGHPA